MPTGGFITFLDYSNETSVTNIPVQDVSEVNWLSVTQDLDELKDAFAAVSLCNVLRVGLTKTFPESGTKPTDKNAQREGKWLVTYRDTTQFLDAGNTIANPGHLKVFNFEIPGADRTLLATDSDLMDITAGAGLALVAAIEANVRSPYNHSAGVTPTIEVISVRYVGRNT